MSRTKTRRTPTRRTQQQAQQPRKAPAPIPPLRLVNLTKPEPDPRPALPVREFITAPAITAFYWARLGGLPTTRITDWATDADGTAHLDRGPRGTLTHTPDAPTPFLATIPCRHNAHQYPITTGRDLNGAEHHAQACRHDHDAHTPAPEAAHRARQLGDDIHRGTASATDTQQLNVADLRATHADQPKEHPDHA